MTLRRAALISVSALLLGACTPGVLDEHPQVTHCKTALGWLASADDNVQLISSERVAEDESAEVLLNLRVDGQDNTIRCRYDEVARRGRNRPRASAILVNGDPLSEEDLTAVNQAVEENRNPLRGVRRSIRTG